MLASALKHWVEPVEKCNSIFCSVEKVVSFLLAFV